MPLQADRKTPGAEGAARKAHYGDGKQPWDTICERGWGAQFAAANVIKYIRRTKDPEHSLESARWYYKRLKELQGKLARSHEARVGAAYVYKDLMAELTDAEVMRIVG